MPVESATYINDLNTSYPQATDARSQGDDHLRLIKSVLKNTFPSVTGAFTGVANTWTAAQAISLSGSAAVPLEIISTNADNVLGPSLSWFRDSASPAASDAIGGMNFYGRDSAGNKQLYSRIYTLITDPLSGSEDADLVFEVSGAGTLAAELRLSAAALYPSGSLDLGTSGSRYGTAYMNTLNADAGGTLGDASGDAVTIKGTVVSAFMAALLGSADAAAVRTALGLGTAAVLNTPFTIGQGGTAATDAATAARNLLNGLGTTKGNLLVYNSGWTVLAPP